jgi:hypothetical protein
MTIPDDRSCAGTRPRLDHLAIAAPTLAAGARWLEDLLGVPLSEGGRHAAMGTHNRLLSLGPDLYLEVIAIDREAPAPGRARWFGLDRFSGDPRLHAWILATDAITTAPQTAGAPLALSRGDLRWQMAVPEAGALPLDGMHPAYIAWETGAHPAARLPDRGVRLQSLTVRHPAPEALRRACAGLADPRVSLAQGPAGLHARLRTPRGEVEL